MLKKAVFLFFLFFYPFSIHAEDVSKEVVVNRLLRISIPIDTQSPVLNKPVFLLPLGAKLLDSSLKTNYTDKYHNELELLFYFEKAGNYSIGPFVFTDKEGNSHTSPPVKITVTEREVINLPETKTKSQEQHLKFYTLKPQENLFTNSYIYFVLEVPSVYQSIDILWKGWENIYTEQLPEIKEKNGICEVKFIVFFSKEGKYNLSPIKIMVKKGQNEQMFSSASLNFDVRQIPEELNVIGSGEGIVKSTIYTTTQKNYVQIDISYTGAGNLYNLKSPDIDIFPKGDLLLKKRDLEFYEFYPELKGKVNFSYIFFPPQDSTYQVKIGQSKTFNPKTGAFKNISGIVSAINVMLPSNPQSTEYKETLQSKLNIKTKPDYDFYAIIIGILFVTFLSLGLYLRTLKKSKKRKGTTVKYRYDHFLVVQRAILVYLKFFTGYDLTAVPLSQIREKIKNSMLSEELKSEVINWLEDAFKVRYLDKVKGSKEELLKQQGIDILRKMKRERQLNIGRRL